MLSLMFQRVNLFTKITVLIVGCAFAYFPGGRKIIFDYNFRVPLLKKAAD